MDKKEKEVKGPIFKVTDLFVKDAMQYTIPTEFSYMIGFYRVYQDPENYKIEMQDGDKWVEISLEKAVTILKERADLIKNHGWKLKEQIN
jgi:lysyl-tRNA synthetase class I